MPVNFQKGSLGLWVLVIGGKSRFWWWQGSLNHPRAHASGQWVWSREWAKITRAKRRETEKLVSAFEPGLLFLAGMSKSFKSSSAMPVIRCTIWCSKLWLHSARGQGLIMGDASLGWCVSGRYLNTVEITWHDWHDMCRTWNHNVDHQTREPWLAGENLVYHYHWLWQHGPFQPCCPPCYEADWRFVHSYAAWCVLSVFDELRKEREGFIIKIRSKYANNYKIIQWKNQWFPVGFPLMFSGLPKCPTKRFTIDFLLPSRKHSLRNPVSIGSYWIYFCLGAPYARYLILGDGITMAGYIVIIYIHIYIHIFSLYSHQIKFIQNSLSVMWHAQASFCSRLLIFTVRRQ